MRDIYDLIGEVQVAVKDLPISMYDFEMNHSTKNQAIKGAAKVRKELKGCIDKLNKMRNYVNQVRQEAETFDDAQKERTDNLNAAKKQEIAELENKLAELKASLV